ncbi:MAG: hypothetical protein P8107_12955 [Spirochaetia bacterium]
MEEDKRVFKAGSIDDYTDSMAEEIDKAFAVEWRKRYGYELPEIGRHDRLMIFAAIAQGVVKHLVERSGNSFKIKVQTEQVKDDENLVQSDNRENYFFTHYNHSTVSHPVWDSEENRRHILAGNANVKQADNNWIKSEGAPEIVDVDYDGDIHNHTDET